MDQDATWYAGRPRRRRQCYMGAQVTPIKGAQPPNFRPISIVAKRLPISVTAELVLVVKSKLPVICVTYNQSYLNMEEHQK